MRIGLHVRVCRTRMLHSMSYATSDICFSVACCAVGWKHCCSHRYSHSAQWAVPARSHGRNLCEQPDQITRGAVKPKLTSEATSRYVGILTTAGLAAPWPCAALCCAAKQSRWTDQPRETNPSCANTRAPPNSPDTVVNRTVLLPHEAELNCASARHVMCRCGTAVGSYRPTGSAEYSAERCELT